MNKATLLSEMIIEKLHALTPQQQQEIINFIEFLQFKAQKTEISEKEKPISFSEAAEEYIGCVDGGPGDLASNKDYLRGIGSK